MASSRRQRHDRLEDMLEGVSPAPREKDTGQIFRRRSTNIDLQKSLMQLDDAVAPAFSSSVASRTPRVGLLRHRSYTPRKVMSPSKFNVTDMLFTPSRPSSVLANAADSILGNASTFVNIEISQVGFTEDLTTTNINLLMEDDPGLTASVGLYTEFAQSLSQNPSRYKVLDLLADYENSCTDQVMILRKLVKRARREQQKFQKTYNTLDLLDKERSTWQLIRSLYKDRLETETVNLTTRTDEVVDMEEDSEKTVLEHSEQEIINKLFEKDSVLRQCQLVVDWLENCAQEDLDDIADNVKFFLPANQSVVWENTLHQLQSKKKGTKLTFERPLVDQLDPDAPVRQKRFIDDLDKEDEQRLLQHIFMCIRAGQLDRAQELCQGCGQAWRAATLEGWRLVHDPNYQHLQGSIKPITGNPYRDVWKLVCWRMASEGKYDPFETAIYAALSGNLKSLLPVCHSWYDCLWAYFRTVVDVRVEQEIRLKRVTFRQPMELPASYWDRLMEPNQVFEELSASTNEQICAESQQRYHVIQKHIILGDVPALIEVMYSWVQKERSSLPQHLIRFMAHLILFLRQTGQECKEDLCTVVLETYVERLIQSDLKRLVAQYVATLPPHVQVQWYAHFLEGVKEQEDRQMCLQLAEEASLDLPAITKRVVENIRSKDHVLLDVDSSIALTTKISEEDQVKIEAIDWLIFDPVQRAEAFKQANALMRSFIAVKKHGAARELFHKLPANSIDIIYKTWHAKTGSTILPASDSNAIREYLCLKAYLDAVESFSDWFSLYHHGKPAKPASQGGSSFTERVALEHRMKQYEVEMERWKHNVVRQTQITKDRIYNVLLFTDGGWMVDKQDDPEEENRSHQLKLLRHLQIPGLCLNLHHVLHASGLYSDCLQLADYIASEDYQLYKEFNKDDLHRLLRQIRESSLQLLEANKDPLGYELV